MNAMHALLTIAAMTAIFAAHVLMIVEMRSPGEKACERKQQPIRTDFGDEI